MTPVLLPNRTDRANTPAPWTIFPFARTARKIVTTRMVKPFIGVCAQARTTYAVLLVAVSTTLGAGGARWPYRRRGRVLALIVGFRIRRVVTCGGNGRYADDGGASRLGSGGDR
jgi:hypothetical protein